MNGLVYQPNELMEQTKRFGSINMSNIYYLIMEKLNPKLKNSLVYDEELQMVVIPADEVCEKLNISKRQKSVYLKRMKEIAKQLCNIQTWLSLPGEAYVCAPLFSGILVTPKGIQAYFNDAGKKLSQALLVLDDGRPYTKLPQKDILAIRSEKGRRLAEFVSLFPAKGLDGSMTKDGTVAKECDSEYFRDFMGAPEGMSESNFKRDFITKAVKDLNESESRFKVREVIPREIVRKRPTKYLIVAEIPPEVYKAPSKYEGNEAYKVLTQLGVKPNAAKAICRDFPETQIWENLQLEVRVKERANHIPEIVQAIKENWAAEKTNQKLLEAYRSLVIGIDQKNGDKMHIIDRKAASQASIDRLSEQTKIENW